MLKRPENALTRLMLVISMQDRVAVLRHG